MTKNDHLPVLSLSCAVFALCFCWCFYISIPFSLASVVMAIMSLLSRKTTAKKYSFRALSIISVLMLATGILLAIPKTAAWWTAIVETVIIYLV